MLDTRLRCWTPCSNDTRLQCWTPCSNDTRLRCWTPCSNDTRLQCWTPCSNDTRLQCWTPCSNDTRLRCWTPCSNDTRLRCWTPCSNDTRLRCWTPCSNDTRLRCWTPCSNDTRLRCWTPCSLAPGSSLQQAIDFQFSTLCSREICHANKHFDGQLALLGSILSRTERRGNLKCVFFLKIMFYSERSISTHPAHKYCHPCFLSLTVHLCCPKIYGYMDIRCM